MEDLYKRYFLWLIEQHYIEPELRFRLGIEADEDDFASYVKEVIEKIDAKV